MNKTSTTVVKCKTHIDNKGIYIHNIQHVEHFHAGDDSHDDSQSQSQSQSQSTSSGINRGIKGSDPLIPLEATSASHPLIPLDATDITTQLMPIFMGDSMTVQEFVKITQRATPREITTLVADWVKAGKIHRDLYNKPLWTILSTNNFYPCTLSNWNSQLP